MGRNRSESFSLPPALKEVAMGVILSPETWRRMVAVARDRAIREGFAVGAGLGFAFFAWLLTGY